MNSEKVHHPVHNKSDSRHITGVFKDGNDQKKYNYLGEEGQNRANPAYDSVGNKVFKHSCRHELMNKGVKQQCASGNQNAEKSSGKECQLEGQPENKGKDRET